MIKPTALWNLAHECEEEDAENLGKILLMCAGKEVTLDRVWRIHANVVMKDAGDMDERIEERKALARERQAKHRASQEAPSRDVTRSHTLSRDVTNDCVTNTLSRDVTEGGVSHAPSIHPSVHPSVHPSTHPSVRSSAHSSAQSDINRTVTVTVADENGNGTVDNLLTTNIGRFVDALSHDQTGGSCFFDADHDPVVIAAWLTQDRKSVRRWRQACRRIGEAPFREELFGFYRELCAGETPNNRAAAFNARLVKMEEVAK